MSIENDKKQQEPSTDSEIWFDLDTNTLGFGKTYGEHSYNNKPINALWGSEAIERAQLLTKINNT